jgi:hypothetical protein
MRLVRSPLAWLLAAAIAVPACAAGGAERDPSAVLHAYARALEDGRADDAYRMLSDDARRGTSLEAFRRMVKDNPDEVREVARSLGRPTAPPVVTATVTSPGGQELELVLENGRWKVDSSAIDYVPDSHKEGLDAVKLRASWEGHDKEEMEQVLTALKQALPAATIEETGERATMPYGAGTMQLVREHGLWKIEDFD